MSRFNEFFKGLVQQIQASPRQQPSAVTIPRDHTDLSAGADTLFAPDDHYFQVRVNELYLKSSRKWLKEIDPLVFVVSEFVYDKEMRTVPFVVGPSLVEKHGQPIPDGTLLRDTRVAGLHPYRGGRICLTVMLCETQRKDYARHLLKVVEGTAGALDYSTMLNSYLKLASVVLDGIETLFGSGGTVPLVALRKEFDIDGNDRVRPGYFALVDAPQVDPASLWVREGNLLQGRSMDTAQPFRSADFVLYSLLRPDDGKRSDLELLPFYPVWDRVQGEASKASEEHYRSAKANMISLYETLLLSPDLTRGQALALADEFAETMQDVHKRAVRFSNLGAAATGGDDALDGARKRALDAIQL